MIMYYTYIIQSESDDSKLYFGSTQDLQKRLLAHNAGQSPHTSKYKPWKVIWYAAFSSEQKALAFEKYLKSGSGKAFLTKRLI